MRWIIFGCCFGLAGCDVVVPREGEQDIHLVLSTRDIAMNRPNTDIPEALFRMQPDGTGTVEFTASPDGAQTVMWTLSGDQFCIDASEGLIASFDCATLTIDGADVTFSHTQSNSVATGALVPRH